MNYNPSPWMLACLLLSLCVEPVHADGGDFGEDDWKYERVELNNGKSYIGLVLEANSKHVLIHCVSRRPGSPTIVYKEFFNRHEVKKVERLPLEERKVLRDRIQLLARERERFLAQLKRVDAGNPLPDIGDNIEFRPAKWVDGETKALEYHSKYFVLQTTANENIARLAVLLLEQVYTAYTSTIRPRKESGKPTTILLTGSLTDYQKLIRDRGIHLANPAYYDVDRNQIVCGSDLQRLSEELATIRAKHEEMLVQLSTHKKQLYKLYRDGVPQVLLLPIIEAQKTITARNSENDATFKKARERLFQRLYHEAFHAYLANFVYPTDEGQVPRWLNEGLAQVFETAIVEAGELRVIHAPRDRLDAVHEAIQQKQLLPIETLLRSEAKKYLAIHDGRSPMSNELQISNQHYLSSWALSSYLAFDRKLLGSAAMDQYVRSLKDGVDPVVAFREFVGQPLDEVQKDYLEYQLKLRPTKTP